MFTTSLFDEWKMLLVDLEIVRSPTFPRCYFCSPSSIHPTEPFLAVRSEFHPKRNQARQKLATLPLQRFRDLASDVYFELDRRYPEFREDDVRFT
jgi:hypothetical protein